MFARRKFAPGATLAVTGCYLSRNKFISFVPKSKLISYNRIVIIGAPGSGKETQFELIVLNFGYAHLMTFFNQK